MSMSRAHAARNSVPMGLLACALVLTIAPQAVRAQSGSALFAVGEGSSRQQSARQVPGGAAALPAAVPRAAAQPLRDPATAPAPTPQPTRATAAGTRTATAGSNRRNTRATTPGSIALTGRWHDSQCIPLTGVTRSPPLFVKRQYEFDDMRKAWQLEAAVYNSSACLPGARMLTYRGVGTFVVIGKSRVANNAYDASFRIDRWTATPETREGVLTLLNGRCGSGDFVEGRALDLSPTGCPTLGIRSVAQAPQETELVSVSNGRFFLGSRLFAPGMGDDRPAQLSSYGLVRTP